MGRPRRSEPRKTHKFTVEIDDDLADIIEDIAYYGHCSLSTAVDNCIRFGAQQTLLFATQGREINPILHQTIKEFNKKNWQKASENKVDLSDF